MALNLYKFRAVANMEFRQNRQFVIVVSACFVKTVKVWEGGENFDWIICFLSEKCEKDNSHDYRTRNSEEIVH